MNRSRVWGMVLAASVLARGAAAVQTQLWITDSPEDYAKAEARGLVVGPDGAVTLGLRTESSSADSLAVLWAVAVMPDGSVAVAGDGGRIDRWTASGGLKPWIKLSVGQVLSLAVDGDALVAGTGPDGLIYRVGAKGDTSIVARTGERYVWGLARAGRGAWWAATGTRGRLLKIESGKVSIALDTDESNLVSMTSDGRGGCYAGGDSKGRIVHVAAGGEATTTYDAAEDEVRALALGPDGALYAAALTASATATATAPAEDDSDDDSPPRPQRLQPVRSPVSGGRATVYRIVPDSSAASLWVSPQPMIFALASTPEGVVAATGNRAGLYLLGPTSGASQWLVAPQGQFTALAADGHGRLFAATSNPGALWRLGPGRAERGELLSEVQDARRFAKFGRVRWIGESGGGRIEVQARSGNTDPPDTTWSPWSSTGGDHGPPAARYLQWKIVATGGEPRVSSVEVAWREQNLAPRVDDVTVAPQGIGFREGELQPRSEPITQTLRGGQRVEYSTSTPGPKALQELPEWARGLRTLQWRASDPNGDQLQYVVEVRPENGTAWSKVGDELESTSFTWDTRNLPDGRYRVRVRATDAPSNAVGEELETVALSEPFIVDNTAPTVLQLDLRPEPGAVVVSGRAEDQQSTLVRVDVAVDEDDWREITPVGGLAEDRELSFRTRLRDLDAGDHTIAVRVVDRAGNGATRAGRVTVPRAR